MLRRAISTLALTAVLAAPAAAQVPFWFSGSEGPAGIEAPYGTWQGSFNNSTWFQVFCVDFDNQVGHPTDNFNVWVTPFGGGTGNLRSPGQAWDGYREAAAYAQIMVQPHVFTVAEQTNIQRAIWYTMGFGTVAERNVWVNSYNNYAAAAAVNLAAQNDDDWIVITGSGKQEFIAFRADPPQETVPEPATMTLLATGLAGMAAARRRNKKS